MSRIKGRYVAQVVLEFDVPRDDDTYPLEKIRNSICGGELTEAIRCALNDGADDYYTATVDQLFADIYEVDDGDEGGQDERM